MDKKPTTEQPTRQYLYGEKPTRDFVLDAVESFGRPVSAAEIREHFADKFPTFNLSNVFPDLCALAVNCHSRGNYKDNRERRRSDSGHPFDKLIKAGSGREARYTTYDSLVHGIWELVDVGDKVLRPRLLRTSDQEAAESARKAADADPMFASDEDTRKWTIGAIVQREGQPAFRRALLKAYDGRCAISDCAVEDVLEAAHIAPYRGIPTNIVGNGLLLRADLHKLFDLCLLAIDFDTRTVRLSDVLLQSEYSRFEGARLRDPLDPSLAPLSETLNHHWERCVWLTVGGDGAAQDEPGE